MIRLSTVPVIVHRRVLGDTLLIWRIDFKSTLPIYIRKGVAELLVRTRIAIPLKHMLKNSSGPADRWPDNLAAGATRCFSSIRIIAHKCLFGNLPVL